MAPITEQERADKCGCYCYECTFEPICLDKPKSISSEEVSPKMSLLPHMLEAKEAAELLKISYWALLDKAKKGKIPHVPVGRRVLFSEEGLAKWVQEQEAKSVVVEDKQFAYGKLRKIKG